MRRLFKSALIAISVIGALIAVSVPVLVLRADRDMSRVWEVTPTPLSIPDGPDAIERGRHLVELVGGCKGCHGPNLSGKVMFDVPPIRLVAPNLTAGRGGVTHAYGTEDWVRTLRHGIRPDGSAVQIMPIVQLRNLGASDLGEVIAYLRSVPPVDQENLPSEVRTVGKVLRALGMAPQPPAMRVDHDGGFPEAPPRGLTAEYGRYLALIGCTGCHGANSSGGYRLGLGVLARRMSDPERPPAANLTSHMAEGIGSWVEADLVRAMRYGLRPDGSLINPRYMPWPAMSIAWTDNELQALWLYLETLRPLSTGAE